MLLNLFKKIKRISEKDISNHLMTFNIPDPDFVIRTSGEKRLSNFFIVANCLFRIIFYKNSVA